MDNSYESFQKQLEDAEACAKECREAGIDDAYYENHAAWCRRHLYRISNAPKLRETFLSTRELMKVFNGRSFEIQGADGSHYLVKFSGEQQYIKCLTGEVYQ